MVYYKTMKKSNWHGGKGSGRRNSQDDKKYADNWDKIFGDKKKKVLPVLKEDSTQEIDKS